LSKGSGKGSGVSRSDRRRNARMERLREMVPRDGVVLGIDLGEVKQALAVVDHDVRVLWRKTALVPAHRLGEALDVAVAAARLAGFARVTVACEPTGSRWMQVQRLCGERGLPLVCVQPLVSHIAREQQDLTSHKRDEPDSVLIARLAAELHCYVPEELDEEWAYLRDLGRRREQLVAAATGSVLRVRDFLSVAWPSAPQACRHPFDSLTWLAAVQVVASGCGGDPARLAGAGQAEFAAAVAAAVPGWGGKRPAGQVTRAVFALLDDPDAVTWSRRGRFRRIAEELADLQRTRSLLRAVEADMTGVLTGLGLARLGAIPGLTLTGAAVILAEAGDPHRYETSSSLVKHAGLSPADNASGASEGSSHISRRGRPALRTAVWRAIWGLLKHNPVMTARYQALTAAAGQQAREAAARARPGSAQAAQAARAARAARAKARVACAASLLRWIYFMTVHGADWDPVAASGGTWTPPALIEAA
jgi:transposase